MELASLAISVDSREVKTAREWLNDLSGAGARAEKSMQGVGKGGRDAAAGSKQSATASREAARAMDGQASSAQRLTAMIRTYAQAAVGAFGVREVVRAADAWQGLENRLRLVTGSHTQLQTAMNDVFNIAQRTSQGMDGVGQTFQRFAQNATALGISLDQAATLTETVSKAVAVSGSSAAAAEGALIQFGQALAAGALRGEELQSVLEGATGLAQAIADGMGVPLGALRDLASEGKITGDVLVQALTKARDSVDTQFETRIKTVGQAMVELGNSVTRYIGEMSGAAGASSSLADGISSIADAIDRARGSLEGVKREVDGFRTLTELIQEAWEAADDFGKDFQRMLGTSDDRVRSLADNFVTSFTDSFLATAKEVDAFGRVLFGHISGMMALFKALGENVVIAFENAFNRVRERLSELMSGMAQVMNDTFGTSFDTSIWVGPGDQSFRSLVDAYKEGAEVWRDGFGAYDALARRVGDNGIWRAAEAAMAAYTDQTEGANDALGGMPPALDNTKKKLTEAQKAQLAFEKQRRQYLNGLYGEISAMQDQARGLEEQIALYGLAESAKYDLAIADLEAQQAALAVIDAGAEEIAILERKIELLHQMRGSQQTLERLDAEKAAWETWSRDVEQIFGRVGQSLTDKIVDGGLKARDLLKDIFKALTFNILINPIMGSLQGAITNQLGGMFGYSDPRQGGGSSMLGLAQNASSLYSAVTGGLTSGIASIAGSIGSSIGSSALTSFAAGMKGSTLAAGLAGPTTAGASGAMGLGASVAGALPWIGGGLALAGIASSLMGSFEGETRTGGTYVYDSRTGRSAHDGGWMAGNPGDQVGNAVNQMVDATAAQINSILQAIDPNVYLAKLHGEVEDSEKGRGGVSSGGVIVGAGGLTAADVAAQAYRAGQPLSHQYPDEGGIQFGTFQRGQGHGDRSGSLQDMIQNLAVDLPQTAIQAFQSVAHIFPETIRKMFEGIDADALGADAANAVVQQIQGTIQAVTMFQRAVESLPFANLRDLSFDAAAGLIAAAGGLDNLNAGMSSYFQNFYSEQEQLDHAAQQMAGAFAGIGQVMPDLTQGAEAAKAAFRGIVEGIDPATEAGAELFATMMTLAGPFAELVTGFEGLNGTMVDTTAILRERQSLEVQLLQLQGNTAQLRRRELEALDPTNRALQQRIWAIQDEADAYQRSVDAYNDAVAATNAAWATVQSVAQREIAQLQTTFSQTDSVYKALTRAIDVQRTALNQQMRASEQMVSALRGTVNLVGESVRDLRGMTTETAGMQYQQAMDVIRQAAGGQLPERDRLAEAIQSARGVAEDPDRYASAFDRDFAMLTLANELERVQQAAEPQLSAQEQALEVAREQLAKLDATLAAAQSQINHLRGIDDKTYEQTLETIKLQLAGQDQLDKLSDIDINTFVTEKLTQELLKAQANEEAARRQIEGINSQLSLAQQQLDQLRGLNTTGMSMISALNNLADAMEAQRIATPPPPPSTQAPTVPTDPNAKGNRTYMPANYADATDYALANTDVFSAWLTYSKTMGSMTPEQSKTAMTNFIQQHWRQYGQFEGRKFADGGYYPGGIALVGERGPELINFNRGGYVHTADQTQDILRSIGAGGGGGGVSRELIAEIRALRAENKAHAQSIASLQAQNLRILRQWDGTGMPEQRELVEA